MFIKTGRSIFIKVQALSWSEGMVLQKVCLRTLNTGWHAMTEHGSFWVYTVSYLYDSVFLRWHVHENDSSLGVLSDVLNAKMMETLSEGTGMYTLSPWQYLSRRWPSTVLQILFPSTADRSQSQHCAPSDSVRDKFSPKSLMKSVLHINATKYIIDLDDRVPWPKRCNDSYVSHGCTAS